MGTTYKWGMQFVNANADRPGTINTSENPNDTEWADRLVDLTWLHESPRITAYPRSKTINFYRLILRKTWTVTEKRRRGNDRIKTYVQDAHVLPADLNNKYTDEFGNDMKCYITEHKYTQFGDFGYRIPYSRRPEPPKRYRKELSEHPTAWQFSDRLVDLAKFSRQASDIFKGSIYCMMESCNRERFRNHPVIKNPVWNICLNEACPEIRVHAHCPNSQHEKYRWNGEKLPNILHLPDMGMFDSKDVFEYSIATNK